MKANGKLTWSLRWIVCGYFSTSSSASGTWPRRTALCRRPSPAASLLIESRMPSSPLSSMDATSSTLPSSAAMCTSSWRALVWEMQILRWSFKFEQFVIKGMVCRIYSRPHFTSSTKVIKHHRWKYKNIVHKVKTCEGRCFVSVYIVCWTCTARSTKVSQKDRDIGLYYN